MDITQPESRYQCVIDVCRTMQPRSIIEIGVHRGARAQKFVHECLVSGGSYRGYDAFDQLKNHAQVYNGKGPGNQQLAQAKISRTDVAAQLIVGFTEQTLSTDESADFVFIDGDHRTAGIWRDFRAVQHSRLICFDDVVFDGPEDAGALSIMQHLETQDEWETAIVPFAVPFKPHGTTSIGFAWHYGSLDAVTVEKIQHWQTTIEQFSQERLT